MSIQKIEARIVVHYDVLGMNEDAVQKLQFSLDRAILRHVGEGMLNNDVYANGVEMYEVQVRPLPRDCDLGSDSENDEPDLGYCVPGLAGSIS